MKKRTTCKVCSHALRRKIERAWALGDRSPQYLSECVADLSRAQIIRHLKECELLPPVRKALFARLVFEDAKRRGSSLKESEKPEGIANA
jgi:hypothetical protein